MPFFFSSLSPRSGDVDGDSFLIAMFLKILKLKGFSTHIACTMIEAYISSTVTSSVTGHRVPRVPKAAVSSQDIFRRAVSDTVSRKPDRRIAECRHTSQCDQSERPEKGGFSWHLPSYITCLNILFLCLHMSGTIATHCTAIERPCDYGNHAILFITVLMLLLHSIAREYRRLTDQ
jgi:hypothetical protein